jgi:acyl CoA:acetate/3-ketoacid CoA transferase beta subunit
VSATNHEICVVALAEAFRGDGEILASPMGAVPLLAARLARATFAPDLLMSDGVATLVDADGNPEGLINYRRVFDVVWAGKRHVIMGAAQIDRFGNQNISAVGDWARPKVQLLGVRGAPGNTINHATSYWVPKHSKRVFVPRVDVVSGLGTDKARALGKGGRFHAIRCVVSNLGVFDFAGADGAMRIVSLHPDVSLDAVVEGTGFPVEIPDTVATTPLPTDDQLSLLRRLQDPTPGSLA